MKDEWGTVAVVGAGPAGLMAAEVISNGGVRVDVFDAMPGPGRKFLVAGKSGLNLTHGEIRERFISRYMSQATEALGNEARWASLLDGFSPEMTRKWAAGLGVETFQSSSGRVYPMKLKAAPLLRAWIQRLREQGTRFEFRHRLSGLGRSNDGNAIELQFPEAENRSHSAVVLALGGKSWPNTGSDGKWTGIPGLERFDRVPMRAANVGWEFPWPAGISAQIEGQPLKNLRVSVNGSEVLGELMVTRYGLEGGAMYQLGHLLREMKLPVLEVDFRPGDTRERLLSKLPSPLPKRSRLLAVASDRWKLPAPVAAIVGERNFQWAGELATLVKCCRFELTAARPIEEAISSAGGVKWSELDDMLMAKEQPGVFLAGEMIDWEAPTGGYLIQGCLSTGHRAGLGVLDFLRNGSKRETT